MGAADLPDQPDGPDRARHARDAPQARRAPGELHDPDERVRAYEAMRAHVSAETAEEASSGLQPDEDAQRSYRDEAPQLLETRADQDKRSAGERQADRSADPPEPDRPRGDLQLSKGRDAETTAAIGRVRETEPTISSDVRAVERANRYGGWLESFDRHLKGEDRLKEKIAEKLAAEPRMNAGQALREVADAIRYTFCFQPDNYARGYYDVKERMEDRDAGLSLDPDAGLVRRAARALGTSAFAALAVRSGVSERDLARQALAWRQGGLAGLESLRAEWDPVADDPYVAEPVTAAGVALRAKTGSTQAIIQGNRVTADRLQLRLGRDLRWYPYARSDDDWEPSGAAEADPARALADL